MFKLVIAGLLVLSVQTQAHAQAPSQFEKYQELCELQVPADELSDANLKVIQELDIDNVTELSATVLKMVNVHILELGYTEQELNLAQIKELFLTGDQEYNDLYIVTLKSQTSNREYVHVLSFPGDNPYGAIFLAKTEQPVAWNSDGSISIVEGDKNISCPWN